MPLKEAGEKAISKEGGERKKLCLTFVAASPPPPLSSSAQQKRSSSSSSSAQKTREGVKGTKLAREDQEEATAAVAGGGR